MANTLTADNAPADNAPPDVAAKPRSASRWVLTSVAGAGILVLGLLGGMPIGQQVGLSMAHDRAVGALITMEHQHNGQREHVREHIRERLQDTRDKRRPGTQQPAPTPVPGDGGQ